LVEQIRLGKPLLKRSDVDPNWSASGLATKSLGGDGTRTSDYVFKKPEMTPEQTMALLRMKGYEVDTVEKNGQKYWRIKGGVLPLNSVAGNEQIRNNIGNATQLTLGVNIQEPDLADTVLLGASVFTHINGEMLDDLARWLRGLARPAAGAYKTFGELKAFLGPAGRNREWHHLVGQTEANLKRFGTGAIHNAGNVVPIEDWVHHEISGYYSSKRAFSQGKTVREWLSTKSFQEQFDFGTDVLDKALKGTLK